MASIINTSRIAIAGLGQLGGSLAMRLREIGCISLFGVSRHAETIRRAVDSGILDAGSTVADDVLSVVDITFLCMSLSATIEFAKANRQHFRSGSIVTDVGSVKSAIVQELRPFLREHGVYFIGAHPMAGSEKSGMENSRADLYANAVVFITPTPDDDHEPIDIVRAFWRDIGAHPVEIDAARHDTAVAYSSHYLHLVAAALCRTTLSHGDPEAQSMACAGGFRDTSRIAASNPEMWTEICRQNGGNIVAVLDEFAAELAVVRDYLKNQNWESLSEYLRQAKTLRDQWPRGGSHGDTNE